MAWALARRFTQLLGHEAAARSLALTSKWGCARIVQSAPKLIVEQTGLACVDHAQRDDRLSDDSVAMNCGDALGFEPSLEAVDVFRPQLVRANHLRIGLTEKTEEAFEAVDMLKQRRTCDGRRQLPKKFQPRQAPIDVA